MDASIKEAGLFRRFVAFLVDFLLLLVPFLLLSQFLIGPAMANALGNDALTSDLKTYQQATGLFREGQDGNYYLYSYDPNGPSAYPAVSGSSSLPSDYQYDKLPEGEETYEAYYRLAWHYVVEVLPTYAESDGLFQPITYTLSNGDSATVGEFTSYGYSDYFAQNFFGLPTRDEVNSSIERNGVTEKGLSGDSEYFKYALSESGDAADFAARPVLQAKYQELVDAGDKDTLKELALYFFDLDKGGSSYGDLGVYGKAVALAIGSDENPTQTYYNGIVSRLNSNAWLALLPAYLPFAFIVFFLVPMVSKDAKTPGKWLMKLSVISLDGYTITMKERTLRSLLMFIIVSIPILPGDTIPIFAFLIICLIDYMFLALSKTKQSLHDRLTHTLEVDSRTSVVFKDEAEKENYMHLHPELFPGYVDPKAQAENEHIAMLDSILDSSTIDRNREEARSITNFDEYEQMKDDEFNAALKRLAEQKEQGYVVAGKGKPNLHKEEGEAAKPEEDKPAEPKKEEKKDEPLPFVNPVSENEDDLLGEDEKKDS